LPSRDEHLAQASKNQKLADTLAKTEFTDWAVTLYFYTAIHLVESYLSIHGYHCDYHAERKKRMSAIPQLRKIFPEYETLRVLSRQARYHAQPISPDDLKRAQEKLAAVEGQITYVTTGKKS
jgi:hypothetical protein